MGVGKTSSCLWSFRDMLLTGELIGALVVAPLRVTNLTWPAEVQLWDEFKGLTIANLRTAQGRALFMSGRAHIYTINYESLPAFIALAKQRILLHGALPYDLEIWDETTKAKNPSSKRVNKFRREMPRAPYRWGLTGTPAPNGLLDLFSQVRLLDDGERLGDKFEDYKRKYFRQMDFMGYKWEIMEGSKDTIECAIADMTLTIAGGEWPIHVEDIELPMPDDIHRMYKKLERDLILQLQTGEITAANAAALVSKLLQFTSGAMYDVDKKWHKVHDEKMDALAKLAKEDGPLLVACNFKHEQERIRKRFPRAKFFEDAHTPATQTELLRQWNAGEVPMLVAHPRSAGHGLNMQGGSWRMVWTTLTYDSDAYQQFIARLARRGQTRTVMVYRLMCPGTVDDVVAESLTLKANTERRLMTALTLLQQQI